MQVHIHTHAHAPRYTQFIHVYSVYRVSLGIENNTCIYMYMYRQVGSKRHRLSFSLFTHIHVHKRGSLINAAVFFPGSCIHTLQNTHTVQPTQQVCLSLSLSLSPSRVGNAARARTDSEAIVSDTRQTHYPLQRHLGGGRREGVRGGRRGEVGGRG